MEVAHSDVCAPYEVLRSGESLIPSILMFHHMYVRFLCIDPQSIPVLFKYLSRVACEFLHSKIPEQMSFIDGKSSGVFLYNFIEGRDNVSNLRL